MGVVQCRGIVGSVARNGHHLTTLLQQVNQSLLIGGPRTRHHSQHFHPFVGGLIAQCGEVGTRYLRLDGRIFVPYSYLSGNLNGCCSSVAGNNFHLDTCIKTFFYGCGNVLTNRIADGCYTLKGKSLHEIGIGKINFHLAGQWLIGKGQGAHGLVLVTSQQVGCVVSLLVG